MGLNLSQIYLRNVNLDAFLKAIGPAWARSIDSDNEPRRRQLLVLFRPPWIALVDSTGDVPKSLALELSGAGEGEALRMAVSSTTLIAEAYRAINGETVDDLSIPPVDPGGPMPLYVDAEMEAWDILKKLDVPPELRLLRGRDVSARQAKKGEKGDLILLERKAPGESVGHGYFVSELKEPRTEEDGPVVEYGLYKKDEKMLADIYAVQVTLDADRVDHLLDVLDHIARRKARPPLHHYLAVVTPTTDEDAQREAVGAFLRDRYRELAKTRPLAFTL